ncbi:hypothetical protein M378DRAFT_16608 [Amanita muscaria Koide BX008]|uniref:Uncharacterized protein n=1 Tax=Amanita muscaria (strain Koide BX008) TaxID=946122 RepID=A0A0C2S2Q5_AMAMK|nr:hypothetical protein M378DRAFT_16608 [Amanita muscaria Koide BX008]
MAHGEQDKADPSLIVETPRIPQPSKRSRGLDYPVMTVNADKSPEKPKAHTGNINRDSLSNKGQSSTSKKPRLTLNTAIERDKTTPVGEACNPDGTLKDASDMVWVNSPSDLTPPPLSTKRGHDDTDDENSDTAKPMRKQPQIVAEETPALNDVGSDDDVITIDDSAHAQGQAGDDDGEDGDGSDDEDDEEGTACYWSAKAMLQPTSTPPLFLYLLFFISVYLRRSPSGPYSLSVPIHSYCCVPITLLFSPSIVLYT